VNPNNCQMCRHKHVVMVDEPHTGHCYMFRDEPTEVCMQHTARQGTLWRTVDVLNLSVYNASSSEENK
jgi:hypothetical protein